MKGFTALLHICSYIPQDMYSFKEIFLNIADSNSNLEIYTI